MRNVEVERGRMVEEASRLRSLAEIAEWKKEIKQRSLTRKFQKQEVVIPKPISNANPDPKGMGVPFLGHLCSSQKMVFCL